MKQLKEHQYRKGRRKWHQSDNDHYEWTNEAQADMAVEDTVLLLLLFDDFDEFPHPFTRTCR